MVGRLLRINILISMLVLLFSVSASAAWPVNKQHVAVLVSATEDAYLAPVDAFAGEVGMGVFVYNLHGDIRHDPELKERMFAKGPSLIFALGAKAAFAAKLWTRERQDIPVIFAMVSNWKKYNLLNGQGNITGIANEVAPSMQFLNLSMFVPNARRIGVIYSPANSSELVVQARKAAAVLGLELYERQISSVDDFKLTYRQLSRQVDGLWLLNDPVTYTLENMDWLKERCVKDRLVCIGQSPNLAEAGMMLSVLPDITTIGSQAASMARNILLRGQKPKEIGVMQPLGTRILLNQRTAERVGVSLSSQTLGLATEVVH